MQDGGSHAAFWSEPLSTEACAPQLVVLWSENAGACALDTLAILHLSYKSSLSLNCSYQCFF